MLDDFLLSSTAKRGVEVDEQGPTPPPERERQWVEKAVRGWCWEVEDDRTIPGLGGEGGEGGRGQPVSAQSQVKGPAG